MDNNNKSDFIDLLNEQEPHIFKYILDSLSDIPNNLSKDETIDFIVSNYEINEIEDLIEEYNVFEIETTEALNGLDEEVLDLVLITLRVPENDLEEQISYIISNNSADKINAVILECESKAVLIESLEETDDDEFELIADHFNLSDMGDKEYIIYHIIEHYNLSQIKTAIEIADKKMVFYNEMIGFDDDVFSFICFNYSSLDYHSFKSLENKPSREEKAFYLIQNHSPYELNQKAVYFMNKYTLFNQLNSLDEVYFRILINNMDAYSFFVNRLDIIFNLLINYSDYIVYIELDKAKARFKGYDELRNLDDKKLLFLANYLNAPEDMIERWIEVSDFDENIFKDYDINPRNHIISFKIKDKKEVKTTESRRFKFNNYFTQNELVLSPKEEIAYYIFMNKEIDEITEGLNSFPNVIVDSNGEVLKKYSDKGEDNPSSDYLKDFGNDDFKSDFINENDDGGLLNLNTYYSDDNAETADDDSDDENNVNIKDDSDDGIKIKIEDDSDDEIKVNTKDDGIKINIEDESNDEESEIKVNIKDSEDNSYNETSDDETITVEPSKDEYTKVLTNLDEDIFKILIRKLYITESNKVSIIDYIVNNYNYWEIDEKIRLIEFKLDEYKLLNSLDDVALEALLNEFSKGPQLNSRFDKIEYLIDNFSFSYIKRNLNKVNREIKSIRRSLIDEDIFFEIATWFKLPLHATKEEQIDYLLLNYPLRRIKLAIAYFERKSQAKDVLGNILEDKFNIRECPYCGAKVRADDKFCTRCGHKLSVTVNID